MRIVKEEVLIDEGGFSMEAFVNMKHSYQRIVGRFHSRISMPISLYREALAILKSYSAL